MGPLGTDGLPVGRKNCRASCLSGQPGGVGTCRQGVGGVSRSKAGFVVSASGGVLHGLYMRQGFINCHRVTPWNPEGNFTQNIEPL